MKGIVCIDFDGVIHDYRGWQGEGKLNEPINGARKYVKIIRDSGFKILVFTCRTDLEEVEQWLEKHDIEVDGINEHLVAFAHNGKCPTMKPLADVYIDDKAIGFDRWDDSLIDMVHDLAAPKWSTSTPVRDIRNDALDKLHRSDDPYLQPEFECSHMGEVDHCTECNQTTLAPLETVVVNREGHTIRFCTNCSHRTIWE